MKFPFLQMGIEKAEKISVHHNKILLSDNTRYRRSRNLSIYRIQWKSLRKIKQNRQKYVHGIKSFLTGGKIMPCWKVPNGSAGGSFPVCAAFSGINPLTGTIFDPTDFGSILRNHVFHISPTKFKKSIIDIDFT